MKSKSRSHDPLKLDVAAFAAYNAGKPTSQQAAVVGNILSRSIQFQNLAKGYAYKEIAQVLGISNDTVRNHMRSIYEKLRVHSRTEAILKYFGK